MTILVKSFVTQKFNSYKPFNNVIIEVKVFIAI